MNCVPLVFSFFVGASAFADDAHPVTVEHSIIGWQGNYKAGHATTVRVTLRSSGGAKGSVACQSTDGDNIPVTYLNNVNFDLAADRSQEVILPMQAGGVSAKVSLHFKLEDGSEWREPLNVPPPLAATQEIITSLGPSIGIMQVATYVRRRPDYAFVPVEVNDVAQLPLIADGYCDVDIVVLPLSRGSLIDQMNEKHVAALRDWVQRGGRLIFATAVQGPQLFAKDGKLAELSPGKIRGVERLRRTIGIESAGGASVDIDTVAAGKSPFVLDYESYTGRVDLWDSQQGGAGLPLVVRSAFGFGQVQVIGLDLDQYPWNEWPGRSRFLANLLQDDRSELEVQESGGVRGEVTHLGYDDLTGQLRTALEQFSHVTFLTFTVVAVLAAVYLLLIGPVDYFFIRSLRLPRHITWGTLLVFVALAGGIGWNVADRSHGRQVWINQVELIDVDLASREVRGTAWIHLYSPASRKYDLQWQPTTDNIAAIDEAHLSWQGLAGHGLGGLSVKARNFQPADGYEVDGPKINGLPVPIAGSKSLRAQWEGSAKKLSSQTLSFVGEELQGELTNPLPFELLDARVLYRGHIYMINRPLAGGATVSLSSAIDVRRQNLQAKITERVVKDQQDRATPWDASRTDLPRIMDMLMFHEAANGSDYTGLAHRFQPELDFSTQIELQEAVLVGRVDATQGDVAVDGRSSTDANSYDQRWTWFRILIPVRSAANSSDTSAAAEEPQP